MTTQISGDGHELTPATGGASVLRGPVLLALAAVYVIWGSTYLAIRIALDTLPPLLMAGARFVVAGALLLGWARLRGAAPLTPRAWRASAVIGFLFMLIANGGVVLAERSVPSGLTSVVAATMPGWAVLFAIRMALPTRRQVAGLVLGFAGVAALSFGGELGGNPIDLIALFAAPPAWALGSVFAARLGLPGGTQGAGGPMLTGGFMLLVAGLATGEGIGGPVAASSVVAVAYLLVFGSLVGFSAYRYLLEHATPAVATSHAFVNPVVALALGAALLDEPLSTRSALAGGIALLGVVLIVLPRRAR
jgi:drug/metabolite transporter (DMT)-like permease